ncbi:MAG: zinc ribbon domain-containing protein [Ruminococcus sp.]|nr:zinc ribbon domain-containing protein [Ruminococcus sp.]
MICNKCGYNNYDNSRFCTACGSNLTDNSVFSIVKSFGKSPLFLVATIAYTATLLLNLVYAFTNTWSLSLQLFNGSMYMPYPREYAYEIASAIDKAVPIGIVLGTIPAIIMCIGMWLVYGSALNRQTPYVKTTGLTMVNVILKIDFIFTLIILSLLEILLLIGTIITSNYSSNSPYSYDSMYLGITIGLILSFFLIAGIIVFLVFYYVKAIKTVNSIKYSAQTGLPCDKISMFVAVISIITGAFDIISILSTPFNIVTILQALCSATAAITFGILLITYRSKMKELTQPTYNPNTVYQNPQQFTQQ